MKDNRKQMATAADSSAPMCSKNSAWCRPRKVFASPDKSEDNTQPDKNPPPPTPTPAPETTTTKQGYMGAAPQNQECAATAVGIGNNKAGRRTQSTYAVNTETRAL